ncbi:MAG: peptidyl-prolyl cis-trans isomerase [Deltaproteobacteria bacterium]|nr:peptidyl-prolyl cis-trans isomerase [Deltaproteobacteria bacterium]
MKSTILTSFFALMLSLTLTGCPPKKDGGKTDGKGGESGGVTQTEKAGPALATIGDTKITVDEFKERLMRQSPFLRARYNTTERKKQFLDNMVRFELLAREAERRGLQQDPDVQETMKKVMVQKLIRQLNEDDQAALPDAELKAFYDAHLTDYVKPERVRLAHILVQAEDPAKKGEAKKKIQAIGKELAKRSAEATAFQMIAREKSDDAGTRSVGGDLGYHTKEELADIWGGALADAAFAMEKVGDVSTVVESEKGLHLLKLTGKQKALDRSFDQVKMQIEGRVRREKRTTLFDDFVDGLRTKEAVKVDEALLESIEVSASGVDGEAGPEGMAGPGGMPGPGGAPGGLNPPMPMGEGDEPPHVIPSQPADQ